MIDLVKQAGGRIDANKTARQLTIAEWAMLVRAFLAWPFRPMVSIPPQKAAHWHGLIVNTNHQDLEQSDLRDAAEFGDD